MAATKIVILGARSFAPEAAEIATEAGFKVEGFIENLDPERCRGNIDGLPVYWVEELGRFARSHLAVCSLGTTRRRSFIEQATTAGMHFATVVHPSARISSRSSLGEGTIVSPGVVVASHTHIGRHCFLNRGVLIGHHSEIADYASLMPGANVAGACRIGDAVWIGMSATVIDHIQIGAGSTVGAGAVVTNDVPQSSLVVGVPARVVKKDVEPR